MSADPAYTAFIEEHRRLAEEAWAARNNKAETSSQLSSQLSSPPAQVKRKANADINPIGYIPETQSSATLSQQTQVPSTQNPTTVGTGSKAKPGKIPPSLSLSEVESDQETPRAKNNESPQAGSDPTPTPTPTPTVKKAKIAGYKDRKELARRMRLEPKDSFAIRERREFLKMQCMRRGQILNKPFEDWDTAVMYKLVRTVNPEMQGQFGGWWPSDLTRDLIHAICLDKVRNTNARERAQKKKVSENASPSRKRKELRPMAPDSPESSEVDVVATKKRAPGTGPKKPRQSLPLICNPVTPKGKLNSLATDQLPPTSPLDMSYEELLPLSPFETRSKSQRQPTTGALQHPHLELVIDCNPSRSIKESLWQCLANQ